MKCSEAEWLRPWKACWKIARNESGKLTNLSDKEGLWNISEISIIQLWLNLRKSEAEGCLGALPLGRHGDKSNYVFPLQKCQLVLQNGASNEFKSAKSSALRRGVSGVAGIVLWWQRSLGIRLPPSTLIMDRRKSELQKHGCVLTWPQIWQIVFACIISLRPVV